MPETDSSPQTPSHSRRRFLRATAAVGAGALATPVRSLAASGDDTINVGIIGTGTQGRVLIEAALNIPDIRFTAVTDIWEYSRRYGSGILRKNGHMVNVYSDHREMLAKETSLDAVLVATPDFMHAPHTIDALEAGCDVYCEKLMAHTVEAARTMVEASRRTGRRLQIGHQRRSNPRYQFARKRLLEEAQILGRITNLNGQWNRAVSEDLGWPQKYEIPADVLAQYGYPDMHAFRNWRWYKDFGGGPISDLGAHQLDIYLWFLGALPESVMAGGGVDYYENHEWYDNVMAIYEFPGDAGAIRAFYQVLTTTSAGGGYFEYFMGTEGALKMSENPNHTALFREAAAPEWDDYVKRGWVRRKGGAAAAAKATVDVRETAALAAWELPITLDKAIHQPHLENFFDAIRGQGELNCPGEEGYRSTVAVLKVNEAVAAGRKLEFTDDEFAI